ncbi:MAG: alpha/beta hydrolase [Bacteroidota bacterium]
MNAHQFYYEAEPQHIQLADASIAVRTYGSGPPLALIHGFFVYGYTWRHVLPELANHFTCYVVDLPGFGESVYTRQTDFTFTAQARRLTRLFGILGISEGLHLMAHDTGASIARMAALDKHTQVNKLVLINTEIPNHRPPFIPMYQVLARLPMANLAFRSLLKLDFVVRSPMMLNQFFYDKSRLMDKRNWGHYVKPLLRSHSMYGMLEYLKGIEWDVVDAFQHQHGDITADTLLVWGEEDKTFPIALARDMMKQFQGNCSMEAIKNTCIMPHEERPREVLEAVLRFLEAKNAPVYRAS